MGTTLPELVGGFLLVTVIVSVGLPPMRSWGDRIAVSSAREEGIALFALARRTAPGSGGALIRIDPSSGAASVLVRGEPVREVNFPKRFGVEVDPGRDGVVELQYDALGLGRGASRTLLFRRGDAEAGVVVSSRGRVRRR